jgi:hypothetical protein
MKDIDYKVNDSTLYFESFDEFTNSISNVLHMSYDEKLAWQKTMGFSSVELEAERMYRTLDLSQFNDKTDVEKYVSSNKNHFILINDQGQFTLETKYYYSPLRYFVDKNGMFQIGNYIAKLYDNKLVLADEIYNDRLKKATLEDALSFGYTCFDQDIKNFKSSTGCGDYNSDTKDNSNERIRLKIECNYLQHPLTGQWYVAGYHQARPYHRTLGIWFRCTREIKVNIYENISWGLSDGTRLSGDYNFTNTSIDNQDELYHCFLSSFSSKEEIYFISYNCSAKQENTSYVYLQCN